MQCAVRSAQRAVCSVQCAVYSEQCAVFSVQFALCSVQCAVCSVQCAVYSAQCAVHSKQGIVCHVQCQTHAWPKPSLQSTISLWPKMFSINCSRKVLTVQLIDWGSFQYCL